MVPGGLDVMSNKTLFTPSISLITLLLVSLKKSLLKFNAVQNKLFLRGEVSENIKEIGRL